MSQGTPSILYCPSCGQRYAMGVELCPHDGTKLEPLPTSATTEETVAAAAPLTPEQMNEFINVSTMPEAPALLPPDTSASTMIDPNAVQPPPVQAADIVGRVMAGYLVQEVLNEGRLGWLFRASPAAGSGDQVAIKYIHPSLAGLREGTLRYCHEAGAVGKLGHRHLPEVLARDATDPNNSYIVTELLQGENLRSLLERSGRLPSRRTVALALQVCEALRAAQTVGVVHLDLRPEHIFLASRGSRDDLVKVTDFGAYRLQSAIQRRGLAPNISPASHRAPELVAAASDDEVASPACDIYSLGVVMYQALSGNLPFAEDARGGSVPRADRITIPLANVVHTVEPELAAVVMRCIARDPMARFPSVEDLEGALKAALAGVPSAEPVMTPHALAEPTPINQPGVPVAPGAGAAWKDASTAPVATPQRSGGRRLVTILLTAVVTIGLALGGGLLLERYLGGPDEPPAATTPAAAVSAATVTAPAATPTPTPVAATEPDAGAPAAVEPDLQVSPDQAPPDLEPPPPATQPKPKPRPVARPKPRPVPRPKPKPRPRRKPKPKPKPASGGKISPNQVKDPFAD